MALDAVDPGSESKSSRCISSKPFTRYVLHFRYYYPGLTLRHQSVVIYFFTHYTYSTNSTRSDGYSVSIQEFSTPMVLAAVLTANLFVGFNTHVWTWWVFFACALGTVLVWIWTVCSHYIFLLEAVH
jgi:hypothetical protein